MENPNRADTVQSNLTLPRRPGAEPAVTNGVPHIQMDQTSDDELYGRLAKWAFSHERVEERPSQASLPGAQGLTIRSGLATRDDAMIVGREFAHIHRHPGAGSLHLRLPEDQAMEVVTMGWGVWHPFALSGSAPGMLMVHAPRTDADLDVVKEIISAAIDYATAGVGDQLDGAS
jgi:phospholipase/carboxylesterase